MENKIKCPHCDNKRSLYKIREDDGSHIVTCCHCGWKTNTIPHGASLDHIPTIQELNKEWQ